MIQILQQLAHLNTVRESLDIISNSITSLKEGVDNIDLASVIDKIEETTAELSSKIEGIQIDTTDLAKELTLTEVSSKLDNLNIDIDLSHISKQGTNTEATNTKILEETLKVLDKIDNIELPEIDTSTLAKQGENADATNSAILKAVSAIVDTKNLYSVRFESNDDGPNTYTMVLPVVAGVVGDTIIL